MSKKFIVTLVSAFSLVIFSVFSFSNALALEGTEPPVSAGSGGGGPVPLTSAVQLCKEARENFVALVKGIKEIKADPLSSQLFSDDTLRQNFQDALDYKKQVCKEAAEEQKK